MDTIQMLALAERDQHAERARMLGHLASAGKAVSRPACEEAEFEDLDLEQIPQFWVSDHRRSA